MTDRYLRQVAFPGLGRKGQDRLTAASAVQVGCGGLGSTLASCMVRSGIGRYTIIDKDRPDLTNLHRQFLFDERDVAAGRGKARTAATKLRRADRNVKIKAIETELTAANVDQLLAGHDLVLDGLDDIGARYVINEWCVRNNVPWVYGGIAGSCGMTMTIIPGRGPCLACLWPRPPRRDQLPTCATAGVINTIPALVAALQATEALKILSGGGEPSTEFRIVDPWAGTFQALKVKRDPDCRVCGGAGRGEKVKGKKLK